MEQRLAEVRFVAGQSICGIAESVLKDGYRGIEIYLVDEGMIRVDHPSLPSELVWPGRIVKAVVYSESIPVEEEPPKYVLPMAEIKAEPVEEPKKPEPVDVVEKPEVMKAPNPEPRRRGRPRKAW